MGPPGSVYDQVGQNGSTGGPELQPLCPNGVIAASAGTSGASITIGLAGLQKGDSADDLIQRADDEVSNARKRR